MQPVNGNSTMLDVARKEFDRRGDEIKEMLERYVIPEAKIKSVVDFCIKTLVNNRQMRSHRIVRKAAEEFKLKKIEE